MKGQKVISYGVAYGTVQDVEHICGMEVTELNELRLPMYPNELLLISRVEIPSIEALDSKRAMDLQPLGSIVVIATEVPTKSYPKTCIAQEIGDSYRELNAGLSSFLGTQGCPGYYEADRASAEAIFDLEKMQEMRVSVGNISVKQLPLVIPRTKRLDRIIAHIRTCPICQEQVVPEPDLY